MEKINCKAGTLLAPVPAVLVSCGSLEKPNALTIAWTGIVNSQPPMTYISVRKSRFSHALIKESGEFVINLVNAELLRAADFCGVRSGRDVDKFALCALKAAASEKVSAPSIESAPVSLECRVTEVLELGSHDMFLAEIVNVRVDASLVEESGRIAYEKAGLVAYSHGEYFALGKKLGKFGYSVEKKRRKGAQSHVKRQNSQKKPAEK